jgi:sugar fermentation stimulation protein A
MRFEPELLPGRLRARRKRFFADISLDSGEEIIAHCPNPGSMIGSADPGAKVFVRALPKSETRKLSHRWVLVERQGQNVCIDTLIANDLAEEALTHSLISAFADQNSFQREFTIDDSRFDFLLDESASRSACLVEVKSVSLIEGDVALFPDSLTARGRKHLQKLMELRLAGYRVALLFLIQAERVKTFRPADLIDHEYGVLLRAAFRLGVEIVACTTIVSPKGLELGVEVPLDLSLEAT